MMNPEKVKRLFWLPDKVSNGRNMPMLAKILSQKHGFSARYSSRGTRRGNTLIQITSKAYGLARLKDADLMIIEIFPRFRSPSEAKPSILLNSSMQENQSSGFVHPPVPSLIADHLVARFHTAKSWSTCYGRSWVSHHGRHKVEGARGVIEAKNAAHPILKGVTDVLVHPMFMVSSV